MNILLWNSILCKERMQNWIRWRKNTGAVSVTDKREHDKPHGGTKQKRQNRKDDLTMTNQKQNNQIDWGQLTEMKTSVGEQHEPVGTVTGENSKCDQKHHLNQTKAHNPHSDRSHWSVMATFPLPCQQQPLLPFYSADRLLFVPSGTEGFLKLCSTASVQETQRNAFSMGYLLVQKNNTEKNNP